MLRTNLIDFIGMESRWHLLKGNFSMIKEGTWPFPKFSGDFIGMESWWHLLKGNFSMKKEGTWPFPKSAGRFYWHGVVKAFIEWVLFHDKGRNLTFYKIIRSILISNDSWWHLLKGSSSTIREKIYSLRITLCHFDRHGFVISIIKRELSHDKRKNFTVTKIVQSIILKLYRDAAFWDESSTITACILSFTTIKRSIWLKWNIDVT
jgi:hypothetical protein